MKVLSTEDNLSSFFGSLKVGEIFGFSQAFSPCDVINYASTHRLRVTPPAKTTTEYKQYGKYVLKVRAILHQSENARIGFESVYYMAEVAKRPRTCKGCKTPHTISQGHMSVIKSVQSYLPDGKRITRHTCYCVPGAMSELQKIATRVQMFLGKIVDIG